MLARRNLTEGIYTNKCMYLYIYMIICVCTIRIYIYIYIEGRLEGSLDSFVYSSLAGMQEKATPWLDSGAEHRGTQRGTRRTMGRCLVSKQLFFSIISTSGRASTTLAAPHGKMEAEASSVWPPGPFWAVPWGFLGSKNGRVCQGHFSAQKIDFAFETSARWFARTAKNFLLRWFMAANAPQP